MRKALRTANTLMTSWLIAPVIGLKWPFAAKIIPILMLRPEVLDEGMPFHARRGALGDGRNPFRQGSQDRRSTSQSATFQRLAAGEHQDDDRSGEVSPPESSPHLKDRVAEPTSAKRNAASINEAKQTSTSLPRRTRISPANPPTLSATMPVKATPAVSSCCSITGLETSGRPFRRPQRVVSAVGGLPAV